MRKKGLTFFVHSRGRRQLRRIQKSGNFVENEMIMAPQNFVEVYFIKSTKT